MGLTRLRSIVSHPIDPDRSAEVELLVDTGALKQRRAGLSVAT